MNELSENAHPVYLSANTQALLPYNPKLFLKSDHRRLFEPACGLAEKFLNISIPDNAVPMIPVAIEMFVRVPCYQVLAAISKKDSQTQWSKYNKKQIKLNAFSLKPINNEGLNEYF